jgi:transcriptional regulator with XRE-family HTH domain
MPKSTGAKIREIREAREMSGAELAKTAGIEASYVSDIENGKKTPSISVLKKIGKALKTDPGYFISDKDILPQDIEGIPPEFLGYLLREEKQEYLRIAKDLDEKNLSPDTIRRYIEAIELIDRAGKK